MRYALFLAWFMAAHSLAMDDTVMPDSTTNKVTAAQTITATEAESEAMDYLSQLNRITIDSDLGNYQTLWQSYLFSDIFVEAHSADEIPYLKGITKSTSQEECREQLPEINRHLSKHFPNLALHYTAIRCNELTGNSAQASVHEKHLEKLSAVMTAKGTGRSLDEPLWAGTSADISNFIELAGYTYLDGLFKYDKKRDIYYYLTIALNEENEEEYFYVETDALLKGLMRAQSIKNGGKDELSIKAINNVSGPFLALAWLAAHGESAAAISLGDYTSGFRSQTMQLAALGFYSNAANLSSPLGIDRYANHVLEHHYEPLYEQAVDYLTQAIEQHYCDAAITLVQMYEKSLGVKRDDEIINGLISLCTNTDKPGDFLFAIANQFDADNGAHWDTALAVDYWERAAKLGHMPSEYKVAEAYLNGRGRKRSMDTALEKFYALGQKDYAQALTELGFHIARNPEYKKIYGSHIDYTLKSANLGNHIGQYNMAYYYRAGQGVEIDPQESFRWAKLSAEQGYAHGMRELGMDYLLGHGTEVDYDQAKHYLEKAAALGNSTAQNALGYMAELGLAQNIDLEAAKDWYTKSARQNYRVAEINFYLVGYRKNKPYLHTDEDIDRIKQEAEEKMPEGMAALGILYRYGTEVEKNYSRYTKLATKAGERGFAPADFMYAAPNIRDATSVGRKGKHRDHQRLKRAMENGHADAAIVLGDNYKARTKWKEAYEYYLKAAHRENIRAMFLVGYILEMGYGVDANLEAAIQWYQKAAEKGSPAAMNALAGLYASGSGLAKNPTKANEWLNKAAEGGLTIAMRNMGRSYYHGIGVEKDIAKSLEWYLKASDEGDLPSIIRVGELFTLHQELGPNYAVAKIYFLAATQRGDHEAMFWLARSYELAPDEEVDTQTIHNYYLAAANAGNSWAMNNIGMMHIKSEAPEADIDDGKDWFEKAHKKGNHTATSNLAWCYEQGIGGRKRMEKAFELYRQAAEAGSPYAQARLVGLLSIKNSEYYDQAAAEHYKQLLQKTRQSKALTIAARSLIILPPEESTPIKKSEVKATTTDHDGTA